MTQGRGRRTDPDVRDQITALHSQGWSVRRIIDLLDADPAYRGRVPAERTVQHLVRGQLQSPDRPWTFLDADPLETAVLLPMLLELPGLRVSVDVAAWMVRLARAVPGLPARTALLLAARYLAAERNARSADQVDVALLEAARNQRP